MLFTVRQKDPFRSFGVVSAWYLSVLCFGCSVCLFRSFGARSAPHVGLEVNDMVLMFLCIALALFSLSKLVVAVGCIVLVCNKVKKTPTPTKRQRQKKRSQTREERHKNHKSQRGIQGQEATEATEGKSQETTEVKSQKSHRS